MRVAEGRTGGRELALDVHPHLFRHHLGTSMVNENMPLTVIADVLDHGSTEMTARYTRFADPTNKREAARWHERIAFPADGPGRSRRRHR